MNNEVEIKGRLDVKWDSYWDGFMTNPVIENVRFGLISRAVDRLMRGFQTDKMHPKICELGAGTAVVAKYLGDKYQGDITVVDSNEEALRLSKETFKDYKNPYKLVASDVFALQGKVEPQDLVVSGGLIEHFVGDARDLIVKAHCDLVAPGGYTLILVPMTNLWYKVLNGFVFKHLHLLDEIPEVPWSYEELSTSLAKFNFKIVTKTTVISELGVLAKRMI